MHTELSHSRTMVGIVLALLAMAMFLSSSKTVLAEDATKHASAAASWTLATDDTKLTVGVGKDQQLYIYELSNPALGWNWTSSPSPLPLVSRADAGGRQYGLQWTYQDGKVDSSDGVKLDDPLHESRAGAGTHLRLAGSSGARTGASLDVPQEQFRSDRSRFTSRKPSTFTSSARRETPTYVILAMMRACRTRPASIATGCSGVIRRRSQ